MSTTIRYPLGNHPSASPQRKSLPLPPPEAVFAEVARNGHETIGAAVAALVPEANRGTLTKAAISAWAAKYADTDLGGLLASLAMSSDEVSVAAASKFVVARVRDQARMGVVFAKGIKK